jgi:hypothetical protein
MRNWLLSVSLLILAPVVAPEDRRWLENPSPFIYARIFSTVQRVESPSPILVSGNSYSPLSEDFELARKNRFAKREVPHIVDSWVSAVGSAASLEMEKAPFFSKVQEASKHFDPERWDAFSLRVVSHRFGDKESLRRLLERYPSAKGVLHLSQHTRVDEKILIETVFETPSKCFRRIRLYRYVDHLDAWLEVLW